MPADRYESPEESVARLLQRRRYAQAIEILRSRLARQRPDPRTRLRLADLLVAAGRGAEAVPVLLSLADELAATGELSKAVAALKRVERLEPQRADVQRRLQRLVEERHRLQRLAAQPEEPPAVTVPPEAPAVEEPPAAAAPAPPEPPSDEGDEAEAPAADGAAAARFRGLLGRLLEPPAPEVTLDAAEPAPVPSPPPDPPAARPAVERRGGLRALLGRLFGRGGEPEAAVEPEPAKAPVESPEAAASGPEPASTPPPEEPAAGEVPPASEPVAEAVAPAVPAPELSPTPEETQPDPSAAATPLPSEPPPAPAAPPAMSEADFHERLLDVVEEMLRREGPAPEPGPAAVEPARLQASPLLGELDEAELARLLQRLELRTCEPGDILLTEGEAGETLFLLLGGTVKVFVRNPENRNLAVLELRGGDFFGEVAVLSGRPRSATITAATPCELLELDRAVLDDLARSHPGMVDTLEAFYLARTQSALAATLRDASLGPEARRRAEAVLRSHFGGGGFDPRTQLKLADALLRSGQREDALALLASLADDLARHGFPEKAVAILKKIERLQGRGVEELPLAPLRRPGEPGTPAPAGPGGGREPEFHGWLVDLVRTSVEQGRPRHGAATAPGLLMSPLFEDFAEDELLSLVRGLRLVLLDPGDVVVTEGEAGNSVFVITSGVVKVFVRDPAGRNVQVGRLGEGDFFGEISLLSGRPRSATVTAAAACELLELDREAFEEVCARHPRVRSVMEEVYIQRAGHPLAARVRSAGRGE